MFRKLFSAVKSFFKRVFGGAVSATKSAGRFCKGVGKEIASSVVPPRKCTA